MGCPGGYGSVRLLYGCFAGSLPDGCLNVRISKGGAAVCVGLTALRFGFCNVLPGRREKLRRGCGSSKKERSGRQPPLRSSVRTSSADRMRWIFHCRSAGVNGKRNRVGGLMCASLREAAGFGTASEPAGRERMLSLGRKL